MLDKENKLEKQEMADRLQQLVGDAKNLAQQLGLDPYPVNYWIVDNKEMDKLAAYGGFQYRYPHWRWGMKYDRKRKESQYTASRIFELVNNDNPSNAFLQLSNSIADQKAVITHVEAHSDFFKNNKWFADNPNAASVLRENAEAIEKIPDEYEDVSKEDVEKFIDHLLCIEDTINQYKSPEKQTADETTTETTETEPEKLVENLDLSEDVKSEMFDEQWLEEQQEKNSKTVSPPDDLVFTIYAYGQQFDSDNQQAIQFEEWQKKVIDALHKEFHYFAPQKMTKCMNEGWAAYWESIMMGNEAFADADEIIEYADHQSKVLNAPGLNPYKLGKTLWEHIENKENRREVVKHLLQIEGINPTNFHSKINFKDLQEQLQASQTDNLVRRHYSLTRKQNRGFIQNISPDELQQINRYVFDSPFTTIEEAVENIDFEAGWKRMREIRETHNDITFIDEFLTEEFVTAENYFAYEYDSMIGQNRISGTDVEKVKKKILLQFTNFGKPTIVPKDINYNNAGELLVQHDYNGIILNRQKAEETLKHIFELWGRPVHLHTIVKNKTEETGIQLTAKWDSENSKIITEKTKELNDEETEEISAEELDYDTTPEEWL